MMSRLEAAEKAVVDAAVAWSAAYAADPEEPYVEAHRALREAAARLRDLRDHLAREHATCGEIRMFEVAPHVGGGIDLTVSQRRLVFCTLPRGHEGRDHEGCAGALFWR